MLETINKDIVLSWNPCGYGVDMIKEYPHYGIEVIDIFEMPIQDEEKFWLLMRPEIYNYLEMFNITVDSADHCIKNLTRITLEWIEPIQMVKKIIEINRELGQMSLSSDLRKIRLKCFELKESLNYSRACLLVIAAIYMTYNDIYGYVKACRMFRRISPDEAIYQLMHAYMTITSRQPFSFTEQEED